MRRQEAQGLEVSPDQLRDWRFELLCDLFGLVLFGPAFAAAHRMILEPLYAPPEDYNLASATHPPYPLRKQLIADATARSTWAREGLSIATATLIEPRYEGIVTLELANLGEIPLTLYPGLELAQIAFTRVDGDTLRPRKGTFTLSFEPTQGKVARETDFPLLPGTS